VRGSDASERAYCVPAPASATLFSRFPDRPGVDAAPDRASPLAGTAPRSPPPALPTWPLLTGVPPVGLAGLAGQLPVDAWLIPGALWFPFELLLLGKKDVCVGILEGVAGGLTDDASGLVAAAGLALDSFSLALFFAAFEP
jgi:hypothetical protein